MNRLKKFDNKSPYLYIMSFAVTFLLYLLLGFVLKLYPSRENTILFSDMNAQFVSFYTFFKNIIHTNNNLFYTFSKNLGGDMIGFSAYYLQNPFAFLLLLFSYDDMPIGIYFMEILMLSTASVTFQIFMKNTFGRGSLVFSTAYGMMGYVVTYFMLSIYLCNIILLPIVIMGAIMVFKDKNGGKIIYVSSLTVSIICNYYLGYMLCLYLCLFFVFMCIALYFDGMNIFKQIKNFAIYSILAVMISAVDLIPIVLSLRNQKDAPSTSIFELSRMFRAMDLYKSLLPGRFNPSIIDQSLPHIYVGVITIVFIIAFTISRNIRLRMKIAALFIVASLLVCLYIKPLNTMWHAFNEPVGFPFRFAFLLGFTLLMIGAMGYVSLFENIEEEYIHKTILGCDLIMLVKLAILAISILELSYNAYYTFRVNISNATSQADYEAYYDRFEPIVSGVKSKEDSSALYRLEKDIQYNMEDAMAFDYAGLTHNSSCETYAVKHFMGRMGFRDQGIWAFYNQGSTAFADSFLSVKYFASRFDSTEKPYENSFSTDDLYVFENPYALEFASIVDGDALASVIEEDTNSFEFQNDVARCYGYNDDIFTEADISEIRIAGNVTIEDGFIERVQENNVSVVNIADSTDEIYVEFDVNVERANEILYFYFAAPDKQSGVRIYVNGNDWDEYFSDWRWAIEKAGKFKPGDVVNIRVESSNEGMVLSDYNIYFESIEKLTEWRENAAILGADDINLSKISSSHIKGIYSLESAGTVLFSIPYDKGWTVKVDGKRVNTRMSLNTLLTFDTDAGYHQIEMTYCPVGLKIGCLISFLGIIVFILIESDLIKMQYNQGEI